MHQTLRNFIVHRQAICDAIEAQRRSQNSLQRADVAGRGIS
jgi:hypothetical protein